MDPWVVGVAVLIPLGWAFRLISNINARVDRLQKEYYSKEETDKMVQLVLAPIEKDIKHINTSIDEIKLLIVRMQDESSKHKRD